jgi:IS5 family transposase
VHTVTTTPANEADVEEVEFLLHGKEEVVHADAGNAGAQTRVNRKALRWEIAVKRDRIKAMKEGRAIERRPYSVAVAALANKLARVVWVVLAKGRPYDNAAFQGV